MINSCTNTVGREFCVRNLKIKIKKGEIIEIKVNLGLVKALLLT